MLYRLMLSSYSRPWIPASREGNEVRIGVWDTEYRIGILVIK